VDPILGGATPIYEYEPGTWGPDRASRLVLNRARWRVPHPKPGQRFANPTKPTKEG